MSGGRCLPWTRGSHVSKHVLKLPPEFSFARQGLTPLVSAGLAILMKSLYSIARAPARLVMERRRCGELRRRGGIGPGFAPEIETVARLDVNRA